MGRFGDGDYDERVACAYRTARFMSERAAVPSRQIPGRVRVTVAGPADAFGGGGRLQACLHVQPHDRQEATLLDCGTSALTGLKHLGLQPDDVTVVAISHLHGDHLGGLPLLLDGQFRHRHRPLHLGRPPGLAQRLEEATEVLFPDSTKVARRFATRGAAHGPRARVGPCAAAGSGNAGPRLASIPVWRTQFRSVSRLMPSLHMQRLQRRGQRLTRTRARAARNRFGLVGVQ